MSGQQIVWIFVWIFFLICGGIMMLGVYFIFGRKGTQQLGRESHPNQNSKSS